MTHLLAKSTPDPEKPGRQTTLPSHTALVVLAAETMLDRAAAKTLARAGLQGEGHLQGFRTLARFGALLHDWGKVSGHFQAMVRRGPREQLVRHEALSALLAWRHPALRRWLEGAAVFQGAGDGWLLLGAVLAGAGHHLKFEGARGPGRRGQYGSKGQGTGAPCSSGTRTSSAPSRWGRSSVWASRRRSRMWCGAAMTRTTTHAGARLALAMLGEPAVSTVLRTAWRVKNLDLDPGVGENRRMDYQELLTELRVAIWVDSSQEPGDGEPLAARVTQALRAPDSVTRFGGLSLGESRDLVDSVAPLRVREGEEGDWLLPDAAGEMTLPVWPDHVAWAITRSVAPRKPPPSGEMTTCSSAPNCATEGRRLRRGCPAQSPRRRWLLR
ncbi:Fruiting body developmental protein S [Chondromyces apiculatus DSM 436]|uniref:Fruiting body developmental protein S n=1 Tax=Chondromyces apiculatus DSM 436 TaxID=1192034 RepID=A0A017TDX2_9BACT|nr:CRISPR-associated endonuclease Cas3'' [Chondromyces apiculatus]EYF07493.1 Fruiting body developmental protein S [Chondromyces apiculatus DSM 436]